MALLTETVNDSFLHDSCYEIKWNSGCTILEDLLMKSLHSGSNLHFSHIADLPSSQPPSCQNKLPQFQKRTLSGEQFLLLKGYCPTGFWSSKGQCYHSHGVCQWCYSGTWMQIIWECVSFCILSWRFSFTKQSLLFLNALRNCLIKQSWHLPCSLLWKWL